MIYSESVSSRNELIKSELYYIYIYIKLCARDTMLTVLSRRRMKSTKDKTHVLIENFWPIRNFFTELDV